MCARSDHGRQSFIHGYRQGRKTPGTADDLRTSEKISNDRIVHVTADWPVMHQEDVCDVAEPFEGIVFVDDNRLVRPVAARCDQRPGYFAHQDMVQRRIWKHYAEVWIARRNRGSDTAGRPTPKDHDRRFCRDEQPLLDRVMSNPNVRGVEAFACDDPERDYIEDLREQADLANKARKENP